MSHSSAVLRTIFGIAIFLLVSVFAGGLAPNHTQAASTQLFFTPEEPRVFPNELLVMELMLSAPSEPINAVGAVIEYDPDVLQLVSYRRNSTAISYWIHNEEDPTDGKINVEGLLVDQGFIGENQPLVELIFRTLQVTDTEVTISNASVHAYDGTGSNILSRIGHGQVSILPGSARPEVKYTSQAVTDISERYRNTLTQDGNFDREVVIVQNTPVWLWVLAWLSVLSLLIVVMMAPRLRVLSRKQKRYEEILLQEQQKKKK